MHETVVPLFNDTIPGYTSTRINSQYLQALYQSAMLTKFLHDFIRYVEIGIRMLDVVIILKFLHEL